MKFRKVKRNLLIAGLLAAIPIVALFLMGYLLPIDDNNEQVSGEATEIQEMAGDFNGDGELEYLELTLSEEDANPPFSASIRVFDKDGNEIASLPEELPISDPMSDTFNVFRLSNDTDKDFFSFDFMAGPHQFERMFFEVRDDMVLPICLTENVQGPYDCLFYTGRSNGFIVDDLDKDGALEVVETRDEYPSKADVGKDVESAIDNAFGDQDVEEFTEGAKRIAQREQGGRGRSVVWSIYSFNGDIFQEQTGEEFERLLSILKEELPDMIAKSELSQESLEYNEFVREFWKGR